MKAAELEALGRRAVACKGWRWMPGMLLLWKLHERGGTYCGRVCHLGSSDSGTGKDVYCEGRGDRFDGVLEVPKCFPDLSDPATLGCLFALVRETWGRPFWVEGDPRSMGERPDEWIGVLFEGRFATCPVVHASTEAEALVAALEAAP